MKNPLFIGICVILFSCSTGKSGDVCGDECLASNNDKTVACKLSSPELQARRTTVLAKLKSEVLEKKELDNGYAYKFNGADSTMNELVSFITTERKCCSFFTFGLSISGDSTEIWLQLTGPDGAKEMIVSEMKL